MTTEVVIIDFKAKGQDKIEKSQKKINSLTERILDNDRKIKQLRARAGDELRALTQTENKRIRILQTRVGLQRNALGFVRLEQRSQKMSLQIEQKAAKVQQQELMRQQKLTKEAEKQAALAKKQAAAAATKAKQERGRKVDSLMMGAGFPLLFGGGAGALAGGVLGAAVGGAGGGFGAQILFSAIGGQIDQFVQNMRETGEALQSTAGTVQFLGDNALWADEKTALLVDQLLKLGKVEEANKVSAQELAQVMGKDTWEAFNELGAASKQLAKDTQILWFEFQRLASYLVGPLLGAIQGLIGGLAADAQTSNLEKALQAEGIDTTELRQKFTKKEQVVPSWLLGEKGSMLPRLDVEGYNKALREALVKSGGTGGITVPITAKDRAQFRPPDSSKGATSKVDEEARQRARLAYEQQLLAIEQQRIPLDAQAMELYKVEVALEKEDLRLKKEIAEIEAGTSAQKALEISVAKTKSERARTKIQKDYQQRQHDLDQSAEEILDTLAIQLKIAEATTEAEKEKYKWLLKQKALDKKGFSEEQIEKILEAMKKLDKATKENKLKDYLENLKKDLEDIEGKIIKMADVIINELSTAMSSSIQTVITGTGSVEEAFSDMFANIGKAFIDMATKMIAQALIMKALGILSGGAGLGVGAGGGGGVVDPVGDYISGGGGGFGNGLLDAWKAFAEGGYVTGPTNALIGEGGENEYVIPESKMASAMTRYSEGSRGEQVLEGPASAQSAPAAGMGTPEVVIQGGTLNFDGTQYIRQDQAGSLVLQGAALGEQRALARLRMSPGTRRNVGI